MDPRDWYRYEAVLLHHEIRLVVPLGLYLVVLHALPVQDEPRGIFPQSFRDDLVQVFHPEDLLVRHRLTSFSRRFVHFPLQSGLHVGIQGQFVGEERQHGGGGLEAGEEEDQGLGRYHVVGQVHLPGRSAQGGFLDGGEAGVVFRGLVVFVPEPALPGLHQ